jgi:predicted nucleic acid-binding protein
MILADSNLLIYAVAQNTALVDWFAENKPAVSAVSLVEVLGYHQLSSADRNALEALFSELTIVYPSAEVFQTAVSLRQQHVMSLGDALIAGTSLYHNFQLATQNTKDFNWITSLDVIDPLA